VSDVTSLGTATVKCSARWASSAKGEAPTAWRAKCVELLAVNKRFLERIQFRYPRIASKVFLNLTRIVSDRLQRMTEQYVAVRT
jgi:hypothetical protein